MCKFHGGGAFVHFVIFRRGAFVRGGGFCPTFVLAMYMILDYIMIVILKEHYYTWKMKAGVTLRDECYRIF
jgi:hypothetical protein